MEQKQTKSMGGNPVIDDVMEEERVILSFKDPRKSVWEWEKLI